MEATIMPSPYIAAQQASRTPRPVTGDSGRSASKKIIATAKARPMPRMTWMKLTTIWATSTMAGEAGVTASRRSSLVLR